MCLILCDHAFGSIRLAFFCLENQRPGKLLARTPHVTRSKFLRQERHKRRIARLEEDLATSPRLKEEPPEHPICQVGLVGPLRAFASLLLKCRMGTCRAGYARGMLLEVLAQPWAPYLG